VYKGQQPIAEETKLGNAGSSAQIAYDQKNLGVWSKILDIQLIWPSRLGRKCGGTATLPKGRFPASLSQIVAQSEQKDEGETGDVLQKMRRKVPKKTRTKWYRLMTRNCYQVGTERPEHLRYAANRHSERPSAKTNFDLATPAGSLEQKRRRKRDEAKAGTKVTSRIR